MSNLISIMADLMTKNIPPEIVFPVADLEYWATSNGFVKVSPSGEFVTVGNVGNTADTTGYGAVDYEYRIGKYEVTNQQYLQFLNAIGSSGDNWIYRTKMGEWSGHLGSGDMPPRIVRSGAAGEYSYSLYDTEWANRPVMQVSLYSAFRFCNWLHNGQPTGEMNAGSTEDGAYDLQGYSFTGDGGAVVRKPGARFWLPTEDEWYKAAYHGNRYWLHPWCTDTYPQWRLVEPDPGNRATARPNSTPEGDFTLGPPYYMTKVGAHYNSPSPYGTFDQGGNVREMIDSPFDDLANSKRVGRGGDWSLCGGPTKSSMRSVVYPASWFPATGFRVCTASEKV